MLCCKRIDSSYEDLSLVSLVRPLITLGIVFIDTREWSGHMDLSLRIMCSHMGVVLVVLGQRLGSNPRSNLLETRPNFLLIVLFRQ